MIAGFNTDIEFDGVVYHVQTEDKGLSARKIISLVYDKGTILASKRTTYDDLAELDFDEKLLSERLNKQHKLICAAISSGRIRELKEMTAKAAQSAHNRPPAVVITNEVVSPEINFPASMTSTFESVDAVSVQSPLVTDARRDGVKMPSTAPAEMESISDPFFDAPLFEDVSIIENDDLFPADAVAVMSELSGTERPKHSKLGIELFGELKYKGGDRLSVSMMICRGTDRKVVPGAQILIKAIGSSFRPIIFHAKSDNNGLAKVHLQIPHFRSGRAALLIRAASDGQEVELRRIVTPG